MLTIGIAGDLMIGRLVNEMLDQVAPTYIWGDLLPLLRANDLNLVNLEAALTKETTPVPKVFNFRADPEKVQVLVEGKIGAVNLANNHILDFGQAGLLETLKTLDSAKIAHVGAGKNITEASQPVILERKGVRIGLLGCTDNEPDWLATEKNPGTCYFEVTDRQAVARFGEAVKALRPNVDLLIVSIHWGPNMREQPPAAFIAFAHQLVEWGVDIVHGHSAHIFQGIEKYKNRLILYDTGDFVDDYAVDRRLRNDRSFLFVVTADRQGPVSLELIPVLIQRCQVTVDQAAEASVQRMQLLSHALDPDCYLIKGQIRVLFL